MNLNGDIPLVRQPLFRQPITPTTRYSDSPILRQPTIPTTHYSDSPLFRQCIFLMSMGKFSQKRPTPFSIFVVVRFDSNYSFHAGYKSQYIGVDTHAYCNYSVLTLVPLSFYVSGYFIFLYISSFVCPLSFCAVLVRCFCVLIYLLSLDIRFPSFAYQGSEVSPLLTS